MKSSFSFASFQEMTSFRDVQNLCLLSRGLAYPKFDLDEMVESECLAEFRFKKRDIHLLMFWKFLKPYDVIKDRFVVE